MGKAILVNSGSLQITFPLINVIGISITKQDDEKARLHTPMNTGVSNEEQIVEIEERFTEIHEESGEASLKLFSEFKANRVGLHSK